MKHLILSLLILFIAQKSQSQLCPESPRAMTELPVTSMNGYFSGFHLPVPGSSISAKGDSCLAELKRQFPEVFDLIDVNSYQTASTSWFQSIEYRQAISGIQIEGRGLIFEFDKTGLLTAIHLYLETEEEALEDLETLASGGSSITHTIQYTDGEYLLVPLEPAHDSGNPVLEENVDINIVVTYPPYNTLYDCTGSDVSVSVPDVDGLLQIGTNNQLIGTYANSVLASTITLSGTLNYDCGGSGCGSSETDHKHETIMSYYHLNTAFQYISEKFKPSVLPSGFSTPSLASITFNEYYPSEIQNAFVTQGGFIGLGGSCNNASYTDLAEDADYIIGAAFASFIRTNGKVIPNGNGEGVGIGLCGYWTWKYMVDKGHAHTNIGSLAGPIPEPIDVISLEGTTKRNYQFVKDEDDSRKKASVWAATLRDIFIDVDALDQNEDLMNTLLLSFISEWGDADIDQPMAAKMLYGKAFMMSLSGHLSHDQFCRIQDILLERYPPATVTNPDEKIVIEKADLFIKDTEEDQFSGQTINEDFGIEPNIVSPIFDKSPSIWNSRTGSGTQDEMPRIGYDNYLRVAIHNQGCDWSGFTGTIEAYVNLSVTTSVWPQQWGVPNEYYVTYLGHSMLMAKHIGTASLTGDYEDHGDERIYTISWMPWDPIPYKSNIFHQFPAQGYLVRIVSDQDLMANEQNGSEIVNVKNNNNIAQRKDVIIYPVYETNTVTVPASAPLIIRGNSTGSSPVEVALKFEYVNPDHKITSTNFDSLGTLKIECSPELLATFIHGHPTGSGFTWLNDSIMQVTSQSFNLPLTLTPGAIYPVLVKYTPTGAFTPVSFHFSQVNSDGCYEGGQYFDVRESYVSPRSSDENKNGIPTKDYSRIRGYPNPANDIYTLDDTGISSIEELKVYNSTGKQILINQQPGANTFSTAGWADGLYFVKVRLINGEIRLNSFIHLN